MSAGWSLEETRKQQSPCQSTSVLRWMARRRVIAENSRRAPPWRRVLIAERQTPAGQTAGRFCEHPTVCGRNDDPSSTSSAITLVACPPPPPMVVRRQTDWHPPCPRLPQPLPPRRGSAAGDQDKSVGSSAGWICDLLLISSSIYSLSFAALVVVGDYSCCQLIPSRYRHFLLSTSSSFLDANRLVLTHEDKNVFRRECQYHAGKMILHSETLLSISL